MECCPVTRTWISLHLFYDSRVWDFLIIKGIKPFLESGTTKKKLISYFFIRYFDKGPHIRLRLLIANDYSEEILSLASEHFALFFKANQSEREKNLTDWFPNNSLQVFQYEPEISRYGGPKAIKVAEEHFHHSSSVVLTFLDSQTHPIQYGIRLGAAIQLNLLFALDFGVRNPDQLKHFFEGLHINWLLWTIKSLLISESKTAEVCQLELMTLFERNFNNQRTQIIHSCEKLLLAYNEGKYKEFPFLKDWTNYNQKTSSRLTQLHKLNEITSSDRNEPGIQFKGQGLWNIYESYIHMTNNRLGVWNKDEAYLAYVLAMIADSPEIKNLLRCLEE